MISMGSIVTGGMLLQSHLLSTTTMNKLLLGICCMTKDLRPERRQDYNVRVRIAGEHSPFEKQWYCLGSSVPDAALTVDASRCFLDGAFRDEGWILCIAGYHQGLTSSSLS